MNIIIPMIFAIAALLGFFLLSYILKEKNAPKGVAMIHGAFGAIGILALGYYSYYHSSKFLISLGLFILAALGGLYLFATDISGKKVPKSFAIGHGTFAIIAFSSLLYFLFF